MDLDDTAGAVEVLRHATALASGSLEAQVALATALTRRKDHGPAAAAWQAALTLKPNDPGLLIDLATSLGELGRSDEALATFRQADALAPGDPRTQYGIALSLERTGNIQAAAEVCRRAVETTPDHPGLWLLLASCEAALGHFDAAVRGYRRNLALAPGSVEVLHALAAAGEGLDDDAAKGAVRSVLDDQSRPVRDRVAAGFTLGRSCDRDGAYDEAFAAYAFANRLLRADLAARGFVFDRNGVHDLVDRLIAATGPQAFADTAGWGDPSELPVFIVGMARSGTSLVEQIAASHPLVFGAGERNDIEEIVAALDRGRPTVSPVAWDRASVRRETMAHVQRLRGLGGSAVRVIDKMPMNLFFLGQIAMLFPRARIVVCRRDPRDVGLSCFFQRFSDDRTTWANDLADCGFQARQTDRLIEHWRKVLPIPILEIQYETLVGNLAAESRRLIDFLGLEWDPACLAFHETERTVLTASYWQVRQPLYTSSVGRWRHYRHHLGPLLRELEGVVPADDEDPDPAGRLDLAEAGYRTVLQHDPNEPDALNLPRLNLQGRGDVVQPIALITCAPDVQPESPETLTDLARAQRAARAPVAAADAARRAIALDPDLTEAHLQLGGALMDLDDTAGAVEALRRATGLAPRSLEAQVALATALTRRKDHLSAAAAWQAALALKPDDPGLLIDLATSLGELGRVDEALAAFRQADALAPGHPRAQYGIALSLERTGNIPAAAEVCRRAVETTPDHPRLWLLLANCETKLGHFDAAASAYRRTLALAPGSVEVLHALVVAGEGLDDDAAKDAVHSVLDDESRPVRDRVAAGFTLGLSRDRDGAYDEAFAAFAVANRLLRADRAAHGFVFDRNADHDLVDRLIAATGPQAFANTAGWGDPSELPVFIVGMPRSGTSLVEQIAASHPLVFGAGERKDIEDILATLDRERPPGRPVAWDRASVRREAMAHVQRLRGLGGNAVRVIDKLPLNVIALGQIAMLFPRARVVVCRRDPRDVCLSCFFQYFREDATMWTNDLADCGFRARQTDRLIGHWRKVLPIPILEIQYETLVANLAAESRRLIDFLELEWDPACLAFHETERTVLTASHWQVRQPLYASSVGRWRHYRHHLGPLLRELEGLVPADDEDPVPAG